MADKDRENVENVYNDVRRLIQMNKWLSVIYDISLFRISMGRFAHAESLWSALKVAAETSAKWAVGRTEVNLAAADEDIVQCRVCEEQYHASHIGMNEEGFGEEWKGEMVCRGCLNEPLTTISYGITKSIWTIPKLSSQRFVW